MAQKEKTGLGKFIQKVGKTIPDILDVGMSVLAGESPLGAIGDKLREKKGESAAAAAAYEEFRIKEMEFEKDMFELRVKDRDSARLREIEIRKTGQFDVLYHLAGLIGLAAFGFICYSLVYLNIPEANKELFIHLVGIVEGVVLSIFAYFFGSSKGSKDKTEALKGKE